MFFLKIISISVFLAIPFLWLFYPKNFPKKVLCQYLFAIIFKHFGNISWLIFLKFQKSYKSIWNKKVFQNKFFWKKKNPLIAE